MTEFAFARVDAHCPVLDVPAGETPLALLLQTAVPA